MSRLVERLRDVLPNELVDMCLSYLAPPVVPMHYDTSKHVDKHDADRFIRCVHVGNTRIIANSTFTTRVVAGNMISHMYYSVYVMDDYEESYNQFLVHWCDYVSFSDVVHRRDMSTKALMEFGTNERLAPEPTTTDSTIDS